MDRHESGAPTVEELRLGGPDRAQPVEGSDWAADFRQTVRWASRVLWRGKFIILACILLVVAPTLLLVKQITPRFTAEAVLVIEAPETNDLLTDRNLVVGRQRLTDAVVQTEAELISSTLLARRVIEKLNLDQDPEFNAELREARAVDTIIASLNPMRWIGTLLRPADGGAADLSTAAREDVREARIIRAFTGRLTVLPQRRSHVISIRFVSEDREKAARIANAVAEAYVLDRLEASFEDARRVTNWLGDRLEGLRQDVVVAENAVETFRATYNLRRSDERRATISDQQLSELNSRLVLARADLSQKQARLAQVRSLSRTRGSVETASDVLQSPLIQRLREQEALKSREVSEAQKVYGDRHPRIVGLRADLEDLQRNIAGEIEKIAASLANEVDVAAAGVRSLVSELESLRQETTAAGAAEVRLRELERQAEATKSLYESLLTRFKREAEMERAQRANARIVSPAEVPVAASYPRSQAVVAVALVLSALFGIVLVFIIDRLDNALRSSDEVEELTGLPTIALVPLHRGKVDRPVEELMQRPRSALADGVRNLRTALELGVPPGIAHVTVVTSSVPKEGKTFVSLCLAVMTSKVEEKVLLIDADLHRPRIHAALGRDEAEVGLANVLEGSVTFDQAVQRQAAGSVDLLPAGRSGNITDLIQAPQFEALLLDLRKRYTRIVIDSPPVLAVADSRILARLAHRVIYLIRWNATPRDAVRNGLKLLRQAGVVPYGIVLSQVNQSKHVGYGYGDYGQYYGRYRDYYGS